MNTVSNDQSTINWYNQSIQKILSSQVQTSTNEDKNKTEGSVGSIGQAYQSSIFAGGTSNIINPLDNLVSNGTITEDQETIIQNAFKAAFKSNQTNSGTYNKVSNPLDNLVSSGIITQEQKTAVESNFKPAFKPGETKENNNVNPLDTLVSNGTITQEQEDAVQSALKSVFSENETQQKSDNG